MMLELEVNEVEDDEFEPVAPTENSKIIFEKFEFKARQTLRLTQVHTHRLKALKRFLFLYIKIVCNILHTIAF